MRGNCSPNLRGNHAIGGPWRCGRLTCSMFAGHLADAGGVAAQRMRAQNFRTESAASGQR